MLPPKFKAHFSIMILLCFFHIVQPAAAQSAVRENYMAYHQGIIRCEEQFLYHNSIRKALNGYRELFSTYKKPFAKDCFIALQLACYIKDTANTTFFFRTAFERGVTWTAIEMAPAIKNFFDRKQKYKKEIFDLYPECREKWQGSINYSLRRTINDLMKRDTELKVWTERFERNSKEEYDAETVENEVQDSIATEIVKLTKRYGFLGDNVIGFYEGSKADSGTFDKGHCYAITSMIDNQFFHHNCLYFLLKRELDTALVNGEISPAMYATIYEWTYSSVENNGPESWKGHPPNKLCIPSPNKRTAFYKVAPTFSSIMMEDNALINRNRAKIWLPSVDHTKKKKAFEKEEKIRLFFGFFNSY